MIWYTVGGRNFVPCPYRTVSNRTAAFFVFHTVINFLKSVSRTVPRSIQNFKSEDRTVKNGFVFPFFYKKREAYRIKAFSFYLSSWNRIVIIFWPVFRLGFKRVRRTAQKNGKISVFWVQNRKRLKKLFSKALFSKNAAVLLLRYGTVQN